MTPRTPAVVARALAPSRARAAGALALTIGLALTLTACGSGTGAAETGDDGATPRAPSSSPSATPTTAPPAEAAAPAPAPAVDPAAIPLRDATDAVAPETLGTTPVAVALDARDLDMPVLPVGIAPDGQTEVPGDANDAGWYRFGPGTGSDRGATVILAHAGTEETPRGPFSRLKNARAGERVVVTDDDGVGHAYEITDVEVLEKATLDLTPYFVRDGDPRLVLITCGGQWDEDANSYRSNVVVTAVPAS